MGPGPKAGNDLLELPETIQLLIPSMGPGPKAGNDLQSLHALCSSRVCLQWGPARRPGMTCRRRRQTPPLLGTFNGARPEGRE